MKIILLLVEVIREYNKVESKNKFGGKLSLQGFFIVSYCFISYKSYDKFVFIKQGKNI